jgi:RNA polymerase sigma-70 factor (ECF subfamily)
MAKSSTRAATDQRLVDRASGGDREAFGELYDRHVMPVYRHVYCMVNDRQLAEDLTAQTFLQALQACSQAGTRGW